MLVYEPAVNWAVDEVKLKPGDFYLDRHQAIYEAMIDLYAADKACDVIEVERLGLLAHKDLIELETVESQIDDVDEAIEAAEYDFGLR